MRALGDYLGVKVHACVGGTNVREERFTALVEVEDLGGKVLQINFVTRDDDRMLTDIQKFYNVMIEELPANVADLI
ncbi:hypothetical protein CRYUN_Cryun35bG0038900 [Craigia yunnanensis]